MSRVLASQVGVHQSDRGVRDLLRRTLRWRVGIGWYLLAALAMPVGALLAVAVSKGALAYHREHRKAAMLVDA